MEEINETNNVPNQQANVMYPARPVLGLVRKLAAIRRELRHIEKRGRNEHFRYKFMRAEDVAGDIGDALADRNIVIGREAGKCSMQPMAEKGYMCVVECTYVFTDGDSGEQLRVWAVGAGSDSGDKGPYKALTGAFKYALTQALCMRIGDDPEADARTDRPKAPPVLRAVPDKLPLGPTASREAVDAVIARCVATGNSLDDVGEYFGLGGDLYRMSTAQVDEFNKIMDRKGK